MEAIGTLAGGVAHDFNNILSPISGYTEMLLMDVGKNSLEKKHLGVILDCVKHAKGLVNQILVFSKQKEHELKKLNVADVVKEAMILIRSLLPSTIKVTVNIDENCGAIMADPVQIHQVIMNLVTNSYHAMQKKGGKLDISLQKVTNICGVFPEKSAKKGGYICLAVKDTGDGIDSGVMDKIFDPYFSTKKEGKGSGIGLSVVHGIVESHDGHIKIESHKDSGTKFCVYLPECKENLLVKKDKPKKESIQKGSERVLLVDDDPKVAFMETDMLEKLGYDVTCFTSSSDALEDFKNNPDIFDIIVTDLTMPDLTGDKLVEKIYHINPNVPVILCTGLGDTVGKNSFDTPSIKGFLKKPVPVRDMANTVRKVLDK